jgi:hypothetical protein
MLLASTNHFTSNLYACFRRHFVSAQFNAWSLTSIRLTSCALIHHPHLDITPVRVFLSLFPPSRSLSTDNPSKDNMATDTATTSGSVVPRVVTIADNHDLTLRVTEYTEPLKAGEDGRDKLKAIVDFQVTRQYLVDNSESQVIKKLLTTREFADAGKSIINLDEHNPLAVEAILCAIYRKDEDWRVSTLGQEVTARTLKLHWKYLWDIVFSNRFFIIEFRHLDAWFHLWYDKNEYDESGPNLLYPCFQFNHVRGFLSITKDLVYDYAYIKEYKNEKHPDLHVPPRVISKFCSRQIIFSS